MTSENKNKIIDEMILMVTRQTELDYDSAKELLIKNNYNYMKVIKYSNGIIDKVDTDVSNNSINQMVYTEIRSLMDNAAKKFRDKREYEKKKQEYLAALEQQ